MVSVNYNMKINTKNTKVLRVSKGSESDNEDSSCRGNYRTSQEILLLRKHDLRYDASEKSREGQQQRRQSGLKSDGSWIRVNKISISTGKFPKNNFTKEYRVLQANFRKFWFFQAWKKILFSKQKIAHLQLPLAKLFYFSSKVTAFEHTSCTW